jgi:hypothetical protein
MSDARLPHASHRRWATTHNFITEYVTKYAKMWDAGRHTVLNEPAVGTVHFGDTKNMTVLFSQLFLPLIRALERNSTHWRGWRHSKSAFLRVVLYSPLAWVNEHTYRQRRLPHGCYCKHSCDQFWWMIGGNTGSEILIKQRSTMSHYPPLWNITFRIVLGMS